MFYTQKILEIIQETRQLQQKLRSVITVHLMIFIELTLIDQKDLLLSLVDWHVKRVHSMNNLQHNQGKLQDVIQSRTSLILDSYNKSFSTDTNQLIKGRIHDLREMFAVIGNMYPLATRVLDTSSWPPETDELLEFGNSRI